MLEGREKKKGPTEVSLQYDGFNQGQRTHQHIVRVVVENLYDLPLALKQLSHVGDVPKTQK